jgi:hypothetical protein
LEVLPRILYIFGRSSWDVVHYAQSYGELLKMHKIPRGTSKYAHNPMRNSQICTILRGTSKNAQNPTRNFQFCAFLEVPRRIVHIWKFLVGF